MTYRERKLRQELAWFKARYDFGAINPALFAAIKEIEREIGWLEHERRRRLLPLSSRRQDTAGGVAMLAEVERVFPGATKDLILVRKPNSPSTRGDELGNPTQREESKSE